MRIGVFGGSFDPIHIGHLILAEQCREQAQLDQIWFVPSATSPLKPRGPRATERQRLEMLQLAIAGHDQFRVDECELSRGGISFTVDTLHHLAATHPDHKWFLLIGADSLAEFGKWREPVEICRIATPLVYGRSGSKMALESLSSYVTSDRLAEIQETRIESRLIDISSSELRERCAAGKSIRFLVPRAIEAYINTHSLYKAGDKQPLSGNG